MKSMRKNIRSEYKKVGFGDFVPKLCGSLLAVLIILSLAAGCKNAADGGVSSSGGAPAAGGDSGKSAPSLDKLPSVDNFDLSKIKEPVDYKDFVGEVDENGNGTATEWGYKNENGEYCYIRFTSPVTFIMAKGSDLSDLLDGLDNYFKLSARHQELSTGDAINKKNEREAVKVAMTALEKKYKIEDEGYYWFDNNNATDGNETIVLFSASFSSSFKLSASGKVLFNDSETFVKLN